MPHVKRLTLSSLLLCLVIGFLFGGLLPMPWDEEDVSTPVSGVLTPPASTSGTVNLPASPDIEPEPLDQKNNFLLLSTACGVTRALRDGDYAKLAACVHPKLGVTFTPYSTVNPETDLTFTADEIRSLDKDDTVYTWGFVDGRGNLIEMTISRYLTQYVYDRDYVQAPELAFDRVLLSGNALENITEAYPGCRFVDFSFPSSDPLNDGLDWSSLKLVFQAYENNWFLVGIVHGEWTV